MRSGSKSYTVVKCCSRWWWSVCVYFDTIAPTDLWVVMDTAIVWHFQVMHVCLQYGPFCTVHLSALKKIDGGIRPIASSGLHAATACSKGSLPISDGRNDCQARTDSTWFRYFAAWVLTQQSVRLDPFYSRNDWLTFSIGLFLGPTAISDYVEDPERNVCACSASARMRSAAPDQSGKARLATYCCSCISLRSISSLVIRNDRLDITRLCISRSPYDCELRFASRQYEWGRRLGCGKSADRLSCHSAVNDLIKTCANVGYGADLTAHSAE